MSRDPDFLIAGAGLNGCALALAAGQAGLSATVIDATPQARMRDDGFDGRSYALARASQRLLEALGLWGALADVAQPILGIKVSDGRAGEGPSPFQLGFDHAELEEGPMGYMVEDRHIRRVLLDALSEASGISLLQDEVVAQTVGARSVRLELASGQSLEGGLLVGCDGRRSGTARRAGITRVGWDYRQTALVCAISHEKPHHGTAHQFFMPPGPLAILPLTGNRSSIVWSEEREQAEAIHKLDDADYLSVLRPRFGDFLGDITLAGQRYRYPLSLSIARSFTARRLALVGDSAHGVHPIAGQGLNAGFRDVAALIEVTAEASRRGEDIGNEDVLARYAAWRRSDVAALALATDGFNRLFSNDNALVRGARDLGLGIVNAIPGLRRSFMREAAGLSGDLPRLLRGQPL